MRILGIDPGTRVTGYGFVEETSGRVVHIDNGGIFPSSKGSLAERIYHIHKELCRLLLEFSPDAVAIEDIFVAKNISSTLKLGHARGSAMIAVQQAQVPLYEYTANQVKKAVTGYGHANKEQIQKMVSSLLKLKECAFTDASDALAVALCHCYSYRFQNKVKIP